MPICWPRSSGWIGCLTARSPGDSEIAEQHKIATRAHQSLIWLRVRQVNRLRSLLRKYYPAALGADLASGRARGAGRRAVPSAGPPAVPRADREPAASRGRQRNIATTAAQIKAALGTEQLTARLGVVPAYAASASALVVGCRRW